MPLSTGQRLLRHDRRLGVRFVAGADEAGRGSLAGPLVVAGVLLDYETLRGHRVRPLALLNDSKQVEPAERERLYHAVVAVASRISLRVIAAAEIDANGLHRSNLWGLRTVLSDLHPLADAYLVDGFRLGPLAPPHRAVVDGDTKSAAIAAASIVAKVTRPADAPPRRALPPLRLLVARRLHHAGPHPRRRGARPVPTAPALVPGTGVRQARRRVNRGERLAARHYRLRGYRILGTNVRAGGYEVDLIARRGRKLVFVEVKERARQTYGGGVGAVNREKRRRVRRAAASWLQAHPESASLEIRFEVASVSDGHVERLDFAED